MNYDAGERGIGRVEGKVDLMLDTMKGLSYKFDAFADDINQRVNRVERRQSWYSGLWAGLVLVVHWIANKMKWLS